MNRTTESANLRYGTLGYKMDAYEGMAKINLHSQSKLIKKSCHQVILGIPIDLYILSITL